MSKRGAGEGAAWGACHTPGAASARGGGARTRASGGGASCGSELCRLASISAPSFDRCSPLEEFGPAITNRSSELVHKTAFVIKLHIWDLFCLGHEVKTTPRQEGARDDNPSARQSHTAIPSFAPRPEHSGGASWRGTAGSMGLRVSNRPKGLLAADKWLCESSPPRTCRMGMHMPACTLLAHTRTLWVSNSPAKISHILYCSCITRRACSRWRLSTFCAPYRPG